MESIHSSQPICFPFRVPGTFTCTFTFTSLYSATSPKTRIFSNAAPTSHLTYLCRIVEASYIWKVGFCVNFPSFLCCELKFPFSNADVHKQVFVQMKMLTGVWFVELQHWTRENMSRHCGTVRGY